MHNSFPLDHNNYFRSTFYHFLIRLINPKIFSQKVLCTVTSNHSNISSGVSNILFKNIVFNYYEL